jgi:hypothetical protein
MQHQEDMEQRLIHSLIQQIIQNILLMRLLSELVLSTQKDTQALFLDPEIHNKNSQPKEHSDSRKE